MPEPFLSRFTPSLMKAEALEAIFVQREPLAQRLVELIQESTTGSSRQHTLLIGPRGIGKTHLVALVYHRLRTDEKLGERLLIAWLREEEWGVASFLDLLIRILSTLRSEYGDAGLEDLDSLYDLAPEAAEERATDLLIQYLGDRTLLVIAENLDDIFSGLGAVGQRRLRAFLQEHGLITLLATSQSLFNGISLQTSPFYGFFRIHHLEEFDFQDAVRLLIQIARLTGKEDLAASLDTPLGRGRIRAVHHLAGGNPRIYVIFSQFLTRESLEDLVDPFMRLLDDLTPYYQARMSWISPQQRKIVDFLRERRGGVAVKDIAKHCFSSPQTASGQLRILREAGYVRSVAAGRESYYELREPLMRLCLDVKRHRGKPVRLFIEFLRAWYSRDELEGKLQLVEASTALEREYLLGALQLVDSAEVDPRVKACASDLNSLMDRADFEGALSVADELIAIRGEGGDWYRKTYCLTQLKRFDTALEAIEEALRLSPGEEPWLVQRILILLEKGDLAEAAASMMEALKASPESSVLWSAFGVLWWAQFRDSRWPRNAFEFWSDAFRKLEKGNWTFDALLANVVAEAEESEMLPVLALGLFMSIRLWLSPDTKGLMRIWLDSWDRVAGHIPTLKLPLRLLERLLTFQDTGDDRFFGELPEEERKLLQDLFSSPPTGFSLLLENFATKGGQVGGEAALHFRLEDPPSVDPRPARPYTAQGAFAPSFLTTYGTRKLPST